MGLETFQFIPDLVDTNPEPTDPVAQGDDHIRGIKFTLQTQWPVIGEDAVTRTALQMNDAALRSEANDFTEVNTFSQAVLGQAAGVPALPSYSFIGDPDTGMYRQQANTLGFAANAVEQLRLSTQEARFAQNVRGVDGSVGAPTYSFSNTTDLGMYRASSDSLGFAASGVTGMTLRATGNAGIFAGTNVSFQADGNMTSPALPAYTFSNDADTGMFRSGPGVLGFSAQGTQLMSMEADGIKATVSFLQRDGSVTNPSYAFENQVNSGMFRPANNQISLVTNSLEAIRIDSIQQCTLRKENTVTRLVDTQARTGWRYTQANGNPMWAIYAGTTPNNTLAFQRYNDAGAFQDIPLSIRQLNGFIRMSTLPTSSAGLISGELWRNPVSPGFVAIV